MEKTHSPSNTTFKMDSKPLIRHVMNILSELGEQARKDILHHGLPHAVDTLAKMGSLSQEGTPKHRIRHALITMAQTSGLSEEDIKKFSGAMPENQNAAYDHASADNKMGWSESSAMPNQYSKWAIASKIKDIKEKL